MKPGALVWLIGAAALFYFLAPKREAEAVAETGGAIGIFPDVGGNYPPIYPEGTGSGALDPTGAQWPGWQTEPFDPTGWPGGDVETGYGAEPAGFAAPAEGETLIPGALY